MSSVDERIVRMVFDNADFLKNITSTISAITGLNKATDEMASNTGGISAMGKAFENAEILATKAGFHIKDVWTQVSNLLEYQIAGKIVDVGKKIANAMTFEGMSDGFKEYELKMGSVQTIMAGTGATLEQVNGYLDDLNHYSDKTIYSFADMTNNIGKFTNAGVELEDAVLAIKGIANEAAISGANANEASRAMYNFSQALSAGYVKLIDWKSIENANMATQGFKDTLLEVASAVGTVEKQSDGMYKVLTKNANGGTMKETVSATRNFNDSLSQQWMTTEVLTKALKIYATDVRDLAPAEKEAFEAELRALNMTEDQIKHFEELGIKATDAASEIKTFTMLIDTLKEAIGSGWAQTWELLIGDFEEAKALWTEVGNVLSKIIDDSSNTRNNLIKGWDSLGGRKDLIDALRNSFNLLMKVIRPIGDALQEVFPPVTRAQLFKLTRGLKDFTASLEVSRETINKVKSVAKGFFSIFDIGLKAVRAFLGAILPAGSGVLDLGGSLLDAAANLGDFLTNLDKSITESKLFQNVFEGIAKVIKPVFDFIIGAGKGVLGFVGQFFGGFKDSTNDLTSVSSLLKKLFDDISSGVDNIKSKIDSMKPIGDWFANLFNQMGQAIGKVFTALNENLSGMALGDNSFGGIYNIFNALISGGILYEVFKGVKSLSGMADSFGGILEKFGDILEGFGEKVGKDQVLLNAAKAVAILAGSLFLVAMIDSDKLTEATMAIGAMVGVITGAMAGLMKAIQVFSTTDTSSVFKIFNKKIFEGSATKMLEMSVTLKAVSEALLAMGASVLMMAIGLRVVSKAAENGHLWDSFVVVSLILGELTAVALILGKYGKDTTKGVGGLMTMATALILVSVALNIVAKAVEGGHMWEALLALTVILGELTGIVLLIENFTKVNLGGMTGLISMAIALNLVVIAVKSIADAIGEHGDILGQAVLVVTLLLTELLAATVIMSEFGGFAALGGLGAIMAAASLLILVQALKQISDLLGQTDQHVWQAIGVIAAGLGILAVELTLMAFTIPGAIGLLTASAALVVFAGALKILSTLKIGEIAKSLITIALGLSLLSAGMLLMVVALPGAIALIATSVGLTMLAGALKLFGSMNLLEIIGALAGLTLALTHLTVVAAVITVLSPILLIFSVTMGVLGAGLLVAGTGLTVFSAGLQSLTAILPMGIQALQLLLTTLLALLPVLVEQVMNALYILANKIIEFGPAMTVAFIVLMESALNAISAITGKAIQVILDLVFSIMDVLIEKAPLLITAGTDLMLALLEGIGQEVPRIIDAMYKLAIDMIVGLATAISENNIQLIMAVDQLMKAVIKAILEWIVEFSPLGMLLPEKMRKGIEEGTFNVLDAFDELVDAAIDGLKGCVDEFIAVAGDFVGGLITGLTEHTAIGRAIMAGAKLGQAAIEGLRSKDGVDAHSDSWETIDVGHDVGGGLVTGMTDCTEDVKDAGADLGSAAIDSIVKPIAEGVPGATKVLDKLTGSVKQNVKSQKELTEACKDNKEVMDDLGAETLKIEVRTQKYTEQIKYNVQAMDNAHDKALTLHERIENAKNGEIEYTKVKKENTKATDENTQSVETNTTTITKSGAATKKNTDLMKEASGTVEAYTKNYGKLYSTLSESDKMVAATEAVKKMAEETYKAAQKAEMSTDTTKKASETLADIVKNFSDMRKKVYDSVKSVFEGDNFFQKFEIKTEVSMQSLLENMKSNIDGVKDWSNKLVELGNKGVSQSLLKHLAELGPKSAQYVNAFSNASAEEIEQANQMFAESLDLPETLSNDVLSSYARAGSDLVQGLANGINQNSREAIDTMNGVGDTMLKELKEEHLGERSPSTITYDDGLNLVKGLANGISDNSSIAVDSANTMCDEVTDAIEENLGSKTFGENLETVLYSAIKDISHISSESGSKAGGSILGGIAKLMESSNSDLKEIGDEIDKSYDNFMKERKENLKERPTDMVSTFKEAFSRIPELADPEKWKAAGEDFVDTFKESFTGKKADEVGADLETLANTSLETFQTALGEESPSKFTYLFGEYLVQGLINGIMFNAPTVVRIVTVLCEQIVDAIAEGLAQERFVTFGRNIGYGLAQGLGDEGALSAVRSAALALSRAAAVTTEDYNGIESPAKRYIGYGNYIALGMAKGMENGVPAVMESASILAESIKNTLQVVESIAENDLELHPVVTPILDTSDLVKKTSSIGRIFPMQTMRMASSVSIGRTQNGGSSEEEELKSGKTNNITFTQNNYSPKALNRTEIYRQTRNQLSMLKTVTT